jgi:Holliday junction resolvasome RuvABC DNA-binding subunit
MLLDESSNNKVANKLFAEKRKLYKAAMVPLDTTLTTATKWSDREIVARTKALAKLGYDKIFRV